MRYVEREHFRDLELFFTEVNLELNSETLKIRAMNLPFHISGPGLSPVSEPGSGSISDPARATMSRTCEGRDARTHDM